MRFSVRRYPQSALFRDPGLTECAFPHLRKRCDDLPKTAFCLIDLTEKRTMDKWAGSRAVAGPPLANVYLLTSRLV